MFSIERCSLFVSRAELSTVHFPLNTRPRLCSQKMQWNERLKKNAVWDPIYRIEFAFFSAHEQYFLSEETQSWFFFLRFLYQDKKGSGFQGNALILIDNWQLKVFNVLRLMFNVLRCSSKTINYQLSTVHFQLSTFNYQLSTIN